MRVPEPRSRMRASRSIPIGLLGALSICCLFSSSCGTSEAAETVARSDVIALAEIAFPRELERPPVQFPHDLHTDAIAKRNEDCTRCHAVRDDGYLSSVYKPLEGAGEDEEMDLYHESCIGCHQEIADEGEKAGPVACGDCHRRHPAYVDSWRAIEFDNSLHYRHVEAAKEKCELCHHVYDEATKQLVYEKGKETFCRDCHREKTEGNRSSFQKVAHEECIGCHRGAPAVLQSEKYGPVQCAGCHDRQRQLQIKRIENPPRLMRNQPDFVLLSAPKGELLSSKFPTVPFSHIDHEGVTRSCRTCHHQTLEACTNCHTLKGTKESDGVTLHEAMHEMMTNHSCVGCHDTKKTAVQCAGCHDRMEQGRLSEEACDKCHKGPLPENLESERARFTSFDAFRPTASEMALTFSPDDIPETVEISVVANEYQPAKMPHRKIIDKLSQNIKDSDEATYFHGSEDVVCEGCHHQSPLGKRPPLCERCHEARAVRSEQLFRPDTLAAFHQQCLGCHESMKLEKPSDCYGCHAKKEGTIETAAATGIR